MALWTPAQIDSALWLDAADASTLTVSVGLVDQWRDKSGGGRHASASGSDRPSLLPADLNGLDAISFDGSNDSLTLATSLAITTEMAVVAVFRRGSSRIISQIMGGTTAGGPPYPTQWWTDNVSYVALGNAYRTHGSANSGTGWFLDAAYRNATVQGLRRNGSLVGTEQTAPSASGSMAYVGRCGTTYHNGRIAEIVVCGIGEIERVEGYLAWKWGLQSGLPVGHQYKNAAPETSSGGDLIAELSGAGGIIFGGAAGVTTSCYYPDGTVVGAGGIVLGGRGDIVVSIGSPGVISGAVFFDFSDKATNIDQWGEPHVDRGNWIGMVHLYAESLQGAVTDNSPIDVEHWPVSGSMSPSGMEHWQSCLDLMVHI